MDSELNEQTIQDLSDKVVQARAGDLSIYGLLSLIDALAPFSDELERAQRRREDGVGQLSSLQTAVLEAEAHIKPSDVKKVLAEEMGRALKPGGSGFSARERHQALQFFEAQLRAAARDTSSKGEQRCKQLREKRSELEACQVVGEPASIRQFEIKVKKAHTDFKGIKEAYEAWEMGKKNFKDNNELQKTKRTYNELKRNVQSAEDALSAELWKRRPAGAQPVASAWVNSEAATAERQPVAGSSPPETKKKVRAAPREAPAPSGRSSLDPGRFGGGGAGGFWGDSASPGEAASKNKGDSLKACLEEEDEFTTAERARRPARMPASSKLHSEGMKQVKNDARKRGQELLLELRSETTAPEPSARVSRPAAHAGPAASRGAAAPMQAWSAFGTEDAAPLAFAPAEWASAAAAAERSPTHVAATSKAAGGYSELLAEEEPDTAALAEGWEAIWSEDHNANYYWNVETDEVTWEVPERLAPVAPAAPVAAQRHAPVATSSSCESNKVQEVISARFGQRHKGHFWTEEGDIPKLSFECACRAIAEELGITADMVRDLDVPSVEEWRINFTRQEWGKIRTRALALEATKRQEAQKLERERAQRRLDKVSKATEDAVRGGAAGGAPAGQGKKNNSGAKAPQGIPGSAPGSAGPSGKAAQPASKKKGKAARPVADNGNGLKKLSHNNAFAAFSDSEDSD